MSGHQIVLAILIVGHVRRSIAADHVWPGAKWMSEDGRTMYLVFSGDDAFSVRKLKLSLAR